MQSLSAQEFTERFADFLTNLHMAQSKLHKDNQLTHQESIVDLFRLWFMDSREIEAIEEAQAQDRGF